MGTGHPQGVTGIPLSRMACRGFSFHRRVALLIEFSEIAIREIFNNRKSIASSVLKTIRISLDNRRAAEREVVGLKTPQLTSFPAPTVSPAGSQFNF